VPSRDVSCPATRFAYFLIPFFQQISFLEARNSLETHRIFKSTVREAAKRQVRTEQHQRQAGRCSVLRLYLQPSGNPYSVDSARNVVWSSCNS